MKKGVWIRGLAIALAAIMVSAFVLWRSAVREPEVGVIEILDPPSAQVEEVQSPETMPIGSCGENCTHGLEAAGR